MKVEFVTQMYDIFKIVIDRTWICFLLLSFFGNMASFEFICTRNELLYLTLSLFC